MAERLVDADMLRRIVNGKKYKRTRLLIAKYPEWRAKNAHLLHQLSPGASATSDDSVGEYEAKRLQRLQANEAALAALGIEKLGDNRLAP